MSDLALLDRQRKAKSPSIVALREQGAVTGDDVRQLRADAAALVASGGAVTVNGFQFTTTEGVHRRMGAAAMDRATLAAAAIPLTGRPYLFKSKRVQPVLAITVEARLAEDKIELDLRLE